MGDGWIRDERCIHPWVRATPLEWVAYLLFLWGLLVAMCALLARLCAFGIEGFSSERPRASLRFGFGGVAGAVAGAFATGVVTVSMASGQPGVPDSVPTSYWLWGPGLAVAGGITAMFLEGNHG